MGKLSNYVMNKMLDHILKVGSFSQPTNLYVALFDGDPSDAGVECPGTEYARQTVNNWDSASERGITNTDQIDFPEIETNDWGDIDYIAIYDADEGGNLIAYDDIESYTTQLGDNLYIGAGDLDPSFGAGGVGDDWANKILDHIFKNDAISVPTNIYVGASKASADDDATGIDEPDGGAYEREIHNNWNIAASKETTNDGVIEFTQATASWGEITHFLISDSLDSVLVDNLIFHGSLTESQLIGNQDTLKFTDEGLTIIADEV
jgi:hypothetical protein